MFRDGDGRQRILPLDEEAEAITAGRLLRGGHLAGRGIPEASRLHAELSFRASEWTICDDGWSQNGTWVNGLEV